MLTNRIQRPSRGLLAIAVSLSLLASTRVEAEAIYRYVGNPYTDIIDETPPSGSYAIYTHRGRTRT